jgi:polyhydroxyalkanoate synthesis regulator phasin
LEKKEHLHKELEALTTEEQKIKQQIEKIIDDEEYKNNSRELGASYDRIQRLKMKLDDAEYFQKNSWLTIIFEKPLVKKPI